MVSYILKKDEVENALKVFHYDILEGNGKISHKQEQAVLKAQLNMKNIELFKIRIIFLTLIS